MVHFFSKSSQAGCTKGSVWSGRLKLNRLVGALGAGWVMTSLVTGCATIAGATLENRLQAIGLPANTATCMATDLNENLSSDDVIDLTRYTFSVASADSAVGIIRELLKIDNPRAVTAVGQASLSCVSSGLTKGLIPGL